MIFTEFLEIAQDNDINADQLAQLECVAAKVDRAQTLAPCNETALNIAEFERIHLSKIEDEDDAISFARYGLAELDLIEFFDLRDEWKEFRT